MNDDKSQDVERQAKLHGKLMDLADSYAYAQSHADSDDFTRREDVEHAEHQRTLARDKLNMALRAALTATPPAPSQPAGERPSEPQWKDLDYTEDQSTADRPVFHLRSYGDVSEAELLALTQPAGEVQPVATEGWRCFHCDMNFANPTLAADHFGPSVHSDPVCKIDAKRIRALEVELEGYREEDTDLHRALHAKDSERATAVRRAEEEGYARGLEDAKKHPETLGLRAMLAAAPIKEAAAPVQTMQGLAESMEEKNARNARVQRRYDELMTEGKHGHYETLFRVVREEVEAARAAPVARMLTRDELAATRRWVAENDGTTDDYGEAVIRKFCSRNGITLASSEKD